MTGKQSIDPSIARIPKVELHLHLEGAIRKSTIQELAGQPDTAVSINNVSDESFKYQNLAHFVATMQKLINSCLRRPEDYQRVSYELFTDLAAQNVRYAEVSFDPFRGRKLGISLAQMLASIDRARLEIMKEKPIQIGLIIGFGREHGPELALEFMQQAIEEKSKGLVGIDLHGNESALAPQKFTETFSLARQAGLGLRAHAGEGEGPESIWGVINTLGVSRVAHGIRALEDPRLIEYLKNNPVTLDVSPSSNVKLGIVPSMAKHPIRELFDRGVRLSLGTDDPLFFNTTISNEYQNLKKQLNFTPSELKAITLSGLAGSFLPEQDKKKLQQEIERDFVVE